MHTVSTRYSSQLLGCSGSGQGSLSFGFSHFLQSDALRGKTRRTVAPLSKPQPRRVATPGSKSTPEPRSPIVTTSSSTSMNSMTSSIVNEVDSGYASSASSNDTPTRVPVPLPFPSECVANTVEFRSKGARGVSLAEWIRLSEKRRTHTCINDSDESLDELVDDWKVLYQCQWPGYDAHTCYVAVPEDVAAGTAPLRKVDLLDMVCRTLADWVLSTTRCKHTECEKPEWAIGLDGITFKHVYVVSVVEVEGYVRKWAPVLEIDAEALKH